MALEIEKTQFKNNTGGFLGVTIIGPRGDDRGIAVEPEGHVWLSEPEQRLTANAPRNPKDNPFIEQEKERIDPETGNRETYMVTPLTPVSEERYVPADARPIPGTMSAHLALREAQAAATSDEPSTVTVAEVPAFQRHMEVDTMGETVKPGQVPQPPRRAAQAAAAAQSPPEPETQPEPTPEPQPPAATPEETAAKVDKEVGEETGAAQPPAHPAPQGGYQASEEVGTPSAPAADVATQPAPYSPPQE